MVNAASIFFCAFFVVFALTLQSFNVFGGHQRLAVVTSLFISAANLVLLKLVPMPSGILESLAYIVGGPLGVFVAFRFQPTLGRLIARYAPRVDTAGDRPNS